MLLITLIMYGGSGVNVYFFCCDACLHDGGVKAITEHSCCIRHHHCHEKGIPHKHENACCAMSHQQSSSMYVCHDKSHTPCSVERVSVNWQTASVEKPDIKPMSFDVFASLFFVLEEKTSRNATQNVSERYTDTQKPPDLGKKAYLSLLNTLII